MWPQSGSQDSVVELIIKASAFYPQNMWYDFICTVNDPGSVFSMFNVPCVLKGKPENENKCKLETMNTYKHICDKYVLFKTIEALMSVTGLFFSGKSRSLIVELCLQESSFILPTCV